MKRKYRTSGKKPYGNKLHESSTFRKIALVLTAFFILGVAGFIYLIMIARDLPTFKQLEEYQPKLASKVYSSDGKVIKEYFIEKRSLVSLEQMPDMLKKAVISTEDRKFFDHWGFDLKRFVKAIFVNVFTLSYEQGASTLTQQLARQIYLENIGLEKTITRKIKELITAIQIERTYTKEEILEMYLNHINFGHGAYGAQSAAHLYFGKDLSDLTLDQYAMMVGILVAPANFTPFWHPDRALSRRNVVLASMHTLNHLSDEDYNEYLKRPIEVVERKSSTTGIAPYFTEYIRQKLQEKYGYDLYTNGLSIFTTLDSRAQACADSAVQRHLVEIQKKVRKHYSSNKKQFKKLLPAEFKKNNNIVEVMRDSAFVDSVIAKRATVQVALVSIDPRNGHILAYVGGRDFDESKFNRVVQGQGRQPGSAFKPFVYTVAIDNGYSPTTEVLNQPVVDYGFNDERWTPRNYDHSLGGPTKLREGLRKSYNLVTVRVLQDLIQNPQLVVEQAHQMGIKSKLEAVPSIALGALNVTPLEITSAYGVFANGGILVEPIYILRIEDKNGNIIEQNIPNRREALRKETAYIMTDMLRTVIDKGTGQRARWSAGFYRPAGGKTGTTDDYSDAWFIGFTPQIVTGVWVGIDDFTITLPPKSDGAKTAIPIWAPYMKTAHDTLGLPELDFPMPAGVTRIEVCGTTNMLANDVCPEILDEVFFTKLAPTEQCDEHIGLTRRGKNRREKDKTRVRF